MEQLYCITTFFNPARFKSLLRNYFVFADHMRQSGVKLLTVELAFNDDEYQIPLSDDVRRLHSSSILWQKERMINFGLEQTESENIAWLDCDVLFNDMTWASQLVKKLETSPIVQPFKKVNFLPKGEISFSQRAKYQSWPSVIWQYKTYKNWFERRLKNELEFAAPGYAWAARREVFDNIGMYDKNIVGSGDAFLVDCFLDKFAVHSYYHTLSREMRIDMALWREKFKSQNFICGSMDLDYLPVDIYHMWHGDYTNRKYIHRQELIQNYDFKPNRDIKLINNVWEWNSHKPKFQEALRQYFYDRKEDES